jgi:hypothetical protein
VNYVIGTTGTLPPRDRDRITYRILSLPGEAAEALVARCAARVVPADLCGLVRPRDLVTPVWAEVFREMISDGSGEPEARDLMAAAAAVTRMSEATARVLMVLAADPELQYEAGGDPSLLEAVIEGTLRRHPSLGAVASAAVRAATEEVIWRFALAAADRGPCLVVPRSGCGRSPLYLRARLLWLWITRFRPVGTG